MVKIKPIQKPYSIYTERNRLYKYTEFVNKLFIALGLYFGFFKVHRKARTILKSFAVCQAFFVTCLCFYVLLKDKGDVYRVAYFLFTVQYLIYSVQLSMIKDKNTLSNIIQDLQVIDIGLKVNSESYHLDAKRLALYFVSSVYRLVFVSVGTSENFTVKSIPYIMAYLGLDIVRLTQPFTFYSINSRLQTLGKLLETANSSDLVKMQFLYKSIVDIAEQFKEDYNPILILGLLFNVPQAMFLMFMVLQKIQSSSAETNIKEFIIIFELLVMTFLPGIYAGMLTAEAKNIKVTLHNLLLEPRDAASYGEIRRFIQYVETRDCRFCVCYVLPLDADLCGIVLSFFVTYIIVMIQFTSNK